MKRFLLILASVFALTCCVPSGYRDAQPLAEELIVYPDYTDLVIPCNIAPMNFIVKNEADACVVEIQGKGEPIVLKGPEVSIPLDRWKKALEENKGGEMTFTVYVKRDGSWLRFADFTNAVASDPIDEYITYRLIEPGYSNYGQLVLVQRRLSDFKEKDLYNNSLIMEPVNQQCINCHSFQNYSAERFQFHAREKSGGTLIVDGDKAKKLAFKTGDLISNAVYPSWHPSEDLIAYSVNSTVQVFFSSDRQRLEAYDLRSDLVLYDVKTDEVKYIVNDSLHFETFPYWAPDGKTLYYASADITLFGANSKTVVTPMCRDIRYSICSVSFDPQTREFGSPQMVFDAALDSLSAVTPRPSPDGKYLLSGVGSYGSFHIWHDSADLYLTDLTTGQTRPLDEVNSDDADSFKAWSSNSRWIVFTTRRDDGAYTRLYLTYFDKDGRAHKPFILPQEDPEQNLRLFKAYNVPEFTRDEVKWSPKDIEQILLHSEPVHTTQLDGPKDGEVQNSPSQSGGNVESDWHSSFPQ